MDDKVIENAIGYIRDLFAGNTDGHDAAHSLRVYHNAMMIADTVDSCDRYSIALAALLHDADDHKLFGTTDNYNARSFLRSQGIDEDLIKKICSMIDPVSFSRNKDIIPDTIEKMIVQDADRLDAIGAVGIARVFAYGGKAGRGMDSSIQHFYDKLLLLKDLMNTEVAKEIAVQRHEFMLMYLEQLRREIGKDRMF